jgi:hypothetical protein
MGRQTTDADVDRAVELITGHLQSNVRKVREELLNH